MPRIRFWITTTSVSYTHLDVYKRQEEELGLRHVRIKTGEGNEASVRLAEALGFSRTEDTEQKSEGILTFEKYMQTDMR